MAFVMGIDLGTSSLKTIIIDEAGRVRALCSKAYQYATPSPGYAEHHPDDWWDACVDTVARAMAQSGLAPTDIKAIGFTGQMHSVVMLDKNGAVVRPSILHCDARSAKQVAEMAAQLGPQQVRTLVKNPIYTGFLFPSLLWVRENEPENFHRIHKVCLPKDYLKFKLSGQVSSDYSDASATLAFDIENNGWSAALLEAFAMPANIFPPCFATCEVVGQVSPTAAAQTGLATGTPLVAGGGDAVMQGIGNGVTALDVATANIGSSGQICYQSARPVVHPGLATNTFCGYKKDRWIVMGAIMHAGLTLKWLGRMLHVTDYAALDAEAEKVGPGSGGLVFLPYLNGERTPHVNPNLSGLFLGCNMGTGTPQMARSVMEGVAFALYQCMEECQSLGLCASSVVASGGGAKSPLWLQIQADVYGLPLRVADTREQASLGAAIAASVGAGLFKNMEDACAATVHYKQGLIQPRMENHRIYQEYYQLFKDCYTANKALLERATRLGRTGQ